MQQSDWKRRKQLAEQEERTAKRYEKIAKLNIILLLAVTAIAALNMRMVITLDNMFANL